MAEAPSRRIVKGGILLKRGRLRDSQKLCHLYSTEFQYHNKFDISKRMSMPSMTKILLVNIQTVRALSKPKAKKWQFQFEIITYDDSSDTVFAAETMKDRDEWVESFHKLMAGLMSSPVGGASRTLPAMGDKPRFPRARCEARSEMGPPTHQYTGMHMSSSSPLFGVREERGFDDIVARCESIAEDPEKPVCISVAKDDDEVFESGRCNSIDSDAVSSPCNSFDGGRVKKEDDDGYNSNSWHTDSSSKSAGDSVNNSKQNAGAVLETDLDEPSVNEHDDTEKYNNLYDNAPRLNQRELIASVNSEESAGASIAGSVKSQASKSSASGRTKPPILPKPKLARLTNLSKVSTTSSTASVDPLTFDIRDSEERMDLSSVCPWLHSQKDTNSKSSMHVDSGGSLEASDNLLGSENNNNVRQSKQDTMVQSLVDTDASTNLQRDTMCQQEEALEYFNSVLDLSEAAGGEDDQCSIEHSTSTYL